MLPGPGSPPDLPLSHGPGLSDEARRQLLARRIVLVHGTLDEGAAAEAAATLMMLDATGDERILLRLTGTDATIEAGLVLMDVLAVLGVPVDVAVAGTVAGGTVGVLAGGRHRTLAARGRLRLHEPDSAVAGRADHIERALAVQAELRERFIARVAACAGRFHDVVDTEWRGNRYLEAADAVALGYADAVEHAPATGAGAGSEG